MKKLILALLLVPSIAKSEVRLLNLELKRMPFQRDYFYPNQKYWQYALDLNYNVGFGNFFWENTIATKTRHDRFRDVYWNYRIGYSITKTVDLLWEHKSQHKMDEYSESFPVRDSYGVRINFLEGSK